MEESPNNQKYFVLLNPVDKKTLLKDTHPIKLQKELQALCPGGIIEVKYLRAGGLSLTVRNSSALERYLQVTTVSEVPVTASLPRTGREISGIVRDVHLELTNEEIESEISESNDNMVVKVRRTKPDSESCLLIFQGSRLPGKVKIFFKDHRVLPYYERPVQCYRCQRFGHKGAQCVSKLPTCLHCGEAGHDHKNCAKRDGPSHCANCDGDHCASSSDCPAQKIHFKIIKFKTKNDISYEDAKTMIHPEGFSYAEALRRIPE